MTNELSAEVEAVRAELLARGVVVLRERRPRKGDKSLTVASYRPEWARHAVPELLGEDWEVDWVGETPREIVPVRILSYRDRGMGGIKLFVAIGDEEHVDEVLLAEDAEKIVLAAYVCSPATGSGGRHRIEAIKKYAARSLDGRPVIDRFSGEVLVNESLLDDRSSEPGM
jgi:hypothetical protein